MNPGNIDEIKSMLLEIRDKAPVFGRIERLSGKAVLFFADEPAPKGAIRGWDGTVSTWGNEYVTSQCRRPIDMDEIARIQAARSLYGRPTILVPGDSEAWRAVRAKH